MRSGCEAGKVLVVLALELLNLVERRIANILNWIIMLLLEEIDLERKNREQFVYIALYVLDAIFLPRPNLWRDVIINRNVGFGMNEFCDIEIEARIIYQNKHIGLPANNIILAHLHVAENGSKMHHYGNEAHVCKFFVMLHHRSANSLHVVAAKEAEFGFGIALLYRLHQV